MAKEKDIIASGFVGMNTGSIEHCLSKMELKIKKGQSGFCGVNSGNIKNSYSECHFSAKKNIVGFCRNTKGIEDCFFLKDGLQMESILDKKYAAAKEKVDGKIPDFTNMHFTEGIEEQDKVIKISTEADLYEMAAKINQAEDDYTYGKYELQNDIDLKGKRWIPIGKGELSPFCGVFNGNGFTVRNFVVKGKKEEVSGLFGYLQDAIIENLNVDGIIYGGKYAGGLAGVNENGKVLGCTTAVRGSGQYCFGGLLGKNSGAVDSCLAVGQVKKTFHAAAVSSAGGIALAAVGIGVAIYLHGKSANGPIYPAIPVSAEAIQIKGDNDKPATGGNSVSYQMNTKIICKNGEAAVHFKNPGKSNHNIVVSIQITDEEMIKKLGKTGRDKEDQMKLEAEKTYNKKTSRVTVAKSGSIPSGYELENIKLSALDDGTQLKAGTYHAVAYLELYDIKTNEKAMIHSQTPVTLVVKK